MKLKLVVLFCGIVPLGFAQTFSEKLSKEASFEVKNASNTVVLANINGDVTVTGYEGEKVIVEASKFIRAKTDERLAMGKTDVQIGLINRADSSIFYVEGIGHSFGRNKNRKNKWEKSEWCYDWNDRNGRHEDLPFDYKMDFVVKVPFGINVVVSTVNDGDVVVENIKGIVHANNINGSIKLTHLVRESVASTINGDVDIDFDKNPEKSCRFYSLNGDINAWFQKGLAANLSFESYNGDLFTNVDKLESLPVIVEKEQRQQGMKYKVNGNRFKVGNGGALLDFETFNGDVYLKEKVN
jgi:hypothetical protein